MEKALLGGRSSHGAEIAQIHGSYLGRGGSCRCLSQTHPAAAGRLSLCAPGHHSQADPFFVASLFGAAWHQPSAGSGRNKPNRKKFERYPIGYFHIDLAEVRTAEGKLYLFVAIDRTSKFTFVELVEHADMRAAAAFLEALVAAVPYRIHTVLTDNGIQFADLPKNRKGPTARWRGHPFDSVCLRCGIEHRLTKPNHPWTNGQVERMNRTIKEATVQRYHYDSHNQLQTHLSDFVAAYNFAKTAQDSRRSHRLRVHL